MSKYSLAHLSVEALLHGLKSHLARERDALAFVLAHLAEVEARELFKPAGYSSMHMYCVHELRLSKDAANKRIRAARVAREFPGVFEKVADGSIRLTSLLILATSFTKENVEELLGAAAYRSDFEVREILAERFPQAPSPTTIEPLGVQVPLVAPVAVSGGGDAPVAESPGVVEVAAQPLQRVVNPLQLKPIGAGQYRATFTMSQAMRDKLRRAKDLLGYRKAEPDEAEILEMGLDLFIARLEKRKFGATDKPRVARRGRSARHIPNAVKRQVWERDGGRCTFMGESGTRCPETRGLEWEHDLPVAQGGTSEPGNIRLLCRAHNQLQAERTYGKPFMEHKRERAKADAAKRKAAKQAAVAIEPELDPGARELQEWLQTLGYSETEAQAATTYWGPPRWTSPETRRVLCLAFAQTRYGERTGT